jgi:hypothetical protein
MMAVPLTRMAYGGPSIFKDTGFAAGSVRGTQDVPPVGLYQGGRCVSSYAVRIYCDFDCERPEMATIRVRLKRKQVRRDKQPQAHVYDSYRPRGRHAGTSRCPDRGAVYDHGRWTWHIADPDV